MSHLPRKTSVETEAQRGQSIVPRHAAIQRQKCIWNRALWPLSLFILSLLPPRGPGLLAQAHQGRCRDLRRNRERRTRQEALCQARSERLGLQRGQRVEREKIVGPNWDSQARGAERRGLGRVVCG